MKLCSIAIFIVFLLLTPTVLYAQQDVTPPTLVQVHFAPAQIDTSTGPQTITVTVHIIDDLSGLKWAALYFRKPGTTQQVHIEYQPTYMPSEFAGYRLSGDDLDGWYTNTLTLPQYAAFGTWEMNSIYLEDNVGNSKSAFKPDDGPEDYARTGWSLAYDAFVFHNGPQEPELPEDPITFTVRLPVLAK
jgi:serine protease